MENCSPSSNHQGPHQIHESVSSLDWSFTRVWRVERLTVLSVCCYRPFVGIRGSGAKRICYKPEAKQTFWTKPCTKLLIRSADSSRVKVSHFCPYTIQNLLERVWVTVPVQLLWLLFCCLSHLAVLSLGYQQMVTVQHSFFQMLQLQRLKGEQIQSE